MIGKNKGGRPLKEIDQHTFENLCGLQCTESEICSWFEITDKTLNAWCKRTYADEYGNPMGFSEVYEQKRGKGKISLRRSQWRLAEHSAAMAMFLGKQYLGQTDTAAASIKIQEAEDDPLTRALKGLAKEMDGESK